MRDRVLLDSFPTYHWLSLLVKAHFMHHILRSYRRHSKYFIIYHSIFDFISLHHNSLHLRYIFWLYHIISLYSRLAWRMDVSPFAMLHDYYSASPLLRSSKQKLPTGFSPVGLTIFWLSFIFIIKLLRVSFIFFIWFYYFHLGHWERRAHAFGAAPRILLWYVIADIFIECRRAIGRCASCREILTGHAFYLRKLLGHCHVRHRLYFVSPKFTRL